MQSDTDGLLPLRERVAQACDTCKQRKVKCDGQVPCSYCRRRHRAHTCRFSLPVRRRRHSEKPSRISTPPSAVAAPYIRTTTPAAPPAPPAPIPTATLHVSPTLTRHSDVSAEEEAEVPRDARLICDAQGRLVFIGDCAPLSLFQTVRQIVTSRVDPHAFSPETSRVSMLENINSEGLVPLGPLEDPVIDPSLVRRLVVTFLTVTSGLVDLFDNNALVPEIQTWAAQLTRPADVTSAVRYLVLAIGSQCGDEQTATAYFLRGKHLALSALGGNLSVGTVQSFLLTTLYMLRSCQINGAYLFFGIAARAAYAIGLHRTEVNSRFGAAIHTRRDRLWKSVRVLDLYLSQSMGRPPAAADPDCTVSYHSPLPTSTATTTTNHNNSINNGSGYVQEKYDLLNASVQILCLVEGIIWEVYSRRKISLQLTEGISRQLREWSGKWLPALLRAAAAPTTSPHNADDEGDDDDDNDDGTGMSSAATDAVGRAGACQVLASYYYGVMLISRPFLMYELCKRLPEPNITAGRPRTATGTGARMSGAETTNGSSGRARLANACIDAATLLIGLVSEYIASSPAADRRMPLLVSWLFASALVVGVGLLGGFGRSLEKSLLSSESALDYFAAHDAHAAQYARIAASLRVCAVSYLERREAEERARIAEASTQMFGLLPREPREDGSRPSSRSHLHSRPHHHGGERDDDRRHNGDGAGASFEQARRPTDPFTSTVTGIPNAPWSEDHAGGPFVDFDPSIFSFGNVTTTAATTTPQTQADFRALHGGDLQMQMHDNSAADQVFGAMNLFPLLDGNGHIDLAHLL